MTTKRETKFVVQPDTHGIVRPDMDAKARDVWARASRLHFNLEFTFSSQPLAACLTPEASMGSSVWPSFLLHGEDLQLVELWEKAMVLWANSTLGLLCHWWVGTRQQSGKSRLSITRLGELTVLDPSGLDDEQLVWTEEIFEQIGALDLLPASEAYCDPVRQELDRTLLVDMLRLPDEVLDPLAVVREQWCAEPTVHGGKSHPTQCVTFSS